MSAHPADVRLDTETPATSREPDGLAALLPRWHLLRDAEEGEPLRALLAVIAEQLDRVRDGVEQGMRTCSWRRRRRGCCPTSATWSATARSPATSAS